LFVTEEVSVIEPPSQNVVAPDAVTAIGCSTCSVMVIEALVDSQPFTVADTEYVPAVLTVID
jgi:hypothetical protein